MTKRLVWIFVCLFALVAVPSSAQTVTAGLKLGLTSSTVAVEGVPGLETSARRGVQGGGWITIGGGTIRLQPELLISNRKFVGETPGGEVSISSRVIDVPVLLSVRGNSGGKVHPTFAAGPYLSFISSTTQTFGGVETNIDDQLKGTDAGAMIGAGLEVDVTRGALVVDVRYVLGLRNIATTDGVTYKSRSWLASVGYRF